MNDAVARLAHAAHIVAERKALLVEQEIELHATEEWTRTRWARENLDAARAVYSNIEVEVRRQAIAIYEETANKTPHPAIKVKMYTVLDYDDGEALDYARVYVPRAVKLGKRKFEQAAKVLEPDFVTIRQEPRATIARDLSEYLLQE